MRQLYNAKNVRNFIGSCRYMDIPANKCLGWNATLIHHFQLDNTVMGQVLHPNAVTTHALRKATLEATAKVPAYA